MSDDAALEAKIQRVLREEISIAAHDPGWPARFEEERRHLLACLPRDLIQRVEHFGSTAVPNLAAKPIVDMLVEVTSLERTRNEVVPILESQGYDYFWRPTLADKPPFYAWFIKRDARGIRTHHIHMVEAHFDHWENLLFRDYLIAHPDVALDYQTLKYELARIYRDDREAYTSGKSEFIARVMTMAREGHGRA